MKDSKLIRVLQTFSKDEMAGFEKFASSPYHSRRKNCVPLLKLLTRFHPEFTSKQVDYQELHKKLYPKKKFNQQVMWNLASSAEKVAADFLIQRRLEKNEFDRQSFLLNEYLERNLYEYCSKLIGKMEDITDSYKIDNEYFLRKFYIEEYKKDLHMNEDKQHLVPKTVINKGEHLILYFLSELKGTINDIYSNYEMYNADYKINIPKTFIENAKLLNLLKYSKENKFQYDHIIEMNYYAMMMFIDENEESYFYKLKDVFEKNEDTFSFNEKHQVTGMLVNYCTRKLASGKNKYLTELSGLNKYRLKHELIFHPAGRIPKLVYLQMLVNALSNGEIEWAKGFIAEYTAKLKPEFRIIMGSLANAFVYDKLKEYDKVLEHLTKVEYIDVRDKMHVKNLMARAYYGLNETEALLSHIDSVKHFLKNSPDLTDNRKVFYNNFFNMLHKITLAREKPNMRELTKIENEIIPLSISSKNWLLKIVKELKM